MPEYRSTVYKYNSTIYEEIYMNTIGKLKTLQVSEDTHILIVEKQLDLRKEGINKTYVEIADEAIAAGIDSVTGN